MRRSLVLLLAAVACRKPAPAPEPAPPPQAAAPAEPAPDLSGLVWSSVAEGTAAQVKQTATARNACRVTASVGDEQKWVADGCVATRGQLRFVSPDAAALLVLTPLPDSDEVVFGRLYRDGKLAVELSPATLHLPPGAVNIEGGKLHWLGPRDQVARAEGVEVQLLDGSLRLIRFDLRSPPPAAAPRAAVAEECAPCAYTDAAGTYHVVETAAEVPPEYRKSSGRIRGRIERADAIEVVRRPYAEAPSQDRPSMQQGPVNWPPPRPVDPNLNELGENFIEYTNRIAGRAATSKPYMQDPKAKCIDNSGARVPCADIGLQPHY